MDLVEMMVMRGGADINVGKANGWTPLYTGTNRLATLAIAATLMVSSAVAAYNGNRETVDFLCSRGANPDEQNDEGWAPLHAAANQGHYKVGE